MTLASILLNSINKSFAKGLFSQALKRAKMLPIFNSKDKLKIANYRQISILPVIGEAYENVFYSRLYYHFSTNNISSSSKFAFRSGVSTKDALLKCTNDTIKCVDDHKVAIITLMDICKAFYCVNHKILLNKINRYGAHLTPIRWISSYPNK